MEVTARGAGVEIVDEDAGSPHELWRNLLLLGIVSTDGCNEATLEIHVGGQDC